MSNSKTKWVIDPTHSELTFKVKHLMISNVKGEFRNFNATVLCDDEDFSNAKITATIESTSIDTNNKDRDNHLRSADFFDSEKYEHLVFESTEVNRLDEDNYQMKGLLEIKGIKKEVVLDVDFGGLINDPGGNRKAGFTIAGKINRKDWGLNWNTALEAGGVMVSDEVRLNGEVQFVKGS